MSTRACLCHSLFCTTIWIVKLRTYFPPLRITKDLLYRLYGVFMIITLSHSFHQSSWALQTLRLNTPFLATPLQLFGRFAYFNENILKVLCSKSARVWSNITTNKTFLSSRNELISLPLISNTRTASVFSHLPMTLVKCLRLRHYTNAFRNRVYQNVGLMYIVAEACSLWFRFTDHKQWVRGMRPTKAPFLQPVLTWAAPVDQRQVIFELVPSVMHIPWNGSSFIEGVNRLCTTRPVAVQSHWWKGAVLPNVDVRRPVWLRLG